MKCGQRIYDAIVELVGIAKSGTETVDSLWIDVTTTFTDWKIDENDNNYIYKDYNINDNPKIKSFEVIITRRYS